MPIRRTLMAPMTAQLVCEMVFCGGHEDCSFQQTIWCG